jgi:hypothetical protein
MAGALFGAYHHGVTGRPNGMPAIPGTQRRGRSTSLPSAPKSRPTNNQSTRRFKMLNARSIKQLLMLLTKPEPAD